MKLFHHDAPAWRAINAIGDLVVLNVLAVITALPLVTAGASLTALAGTSRRMASDDTAVHRLFLASFRNNFVRSTALWAVVGTVGTVLGASWVFLRIPELLLPKALLTICYLLGFFFLWALVARFENTWGNHLRNAWVIAGSNLPLALGVLAIHGVWAGLLVAVTIYAPQGLVVLLLLAVSLPWAISTPLIERAFKPLLQSGA